MFWQPKLRAGKGDIEQMHDGLCLMQMVSWFSGNEQPTDNPFCADSFLSMIGRYLNDNAPSQEDRDSLWPLVWKLIGSYVDDNEIVNQRNSLIAKAVVKYDSADVN